MKVANITNVINKFLENADRAILIDGPWGVGKTHYILEFLKQKKENKSRKLKVSYVSVFGKTNLDEIHTEIYKSFHPHKTRARRFANSIPKIASLLKDTGGTLGGVSGIIGSLEYTLKIDKDSKVVKNNSKKSAKKDFKKRLVILDDFERLDFEKISFNEILGYINSLIMQQLKVIVICNADEIYKQNEKIKNDFITFKEKVFDREYRISATNNEIIESKFQPDLLDEKMAAEFNCNIRLASRTSAFFTEVIKILKECNPNYSEKHSDKYILQYCIYTVVSANSNRYKDTTESKSENNTNDSISRLLSIICVEDKMIEKHITDISNYVKVDRSENYFNTDLLNALFNLYFYDDKTYLENIFKKQDLKTNPLNVNPFLLSDSGKIELFKKQFDYIYSRQSIEYSDLSQAIKNMYSYPMFSNIGNEENKLINHLIKYGNEYGDAIQRLLNWRSVNGDVLEPFCEKLDGQFNAHLVNEFKHNLNIAWKNEDYNLLYDLLSALTSKAFCFNYIECKFALKQEIINGFKKDDFYITKLFGDINYAQWDVALKITDYSLKYGFNKELESCIKSITTNNDESACERYNYLLKVLREKNK